METVVQIAAQPDSAYIDAVVGLWNRNFSHSHRTLERLATIFQTKLLKLRSCLVKKNENNAQKNVYVIKALRL